MRSKTQKFNTSIKLALGFLIILTVAGAARGGTLTVNSNGDGNVCDDALTFREAYLIGRGASFIGRPLTNGERNQISGATFAPAPPPLNCSTSASYWSITSGVGGNLVDNITFSTSVDVIFLTSAFPTISWVEDNINGLKTDGTKAAIDGTNAGNVPGLYIVSTIGFTIRNLRIRNFQREGIYVECSDDGVYEGLELHNNGRDGIALVWCDNPPFGQDNSENNRIGGVNPNQRNLIHSNGFAGIAVINSLTAPANPSRGNIIENNYIGLKDNNGNTDNGNALDGIFLANASYNRIGGETPAARNVISGNDSNGILIAGNNAFGNRVVNNFVGTNKDGTAVIGNAQTGIALVLGAGQAANPNVIGEAGKGNVVAGNFFGIGLFDAATANNVVQGNFIGTDLAANLNLGNVRDGVYVNNAPDNSIGGGGNGESNVIAYNGGAGVFAEGAAANNSLRRNRIFLNGGLGIDLFPSGVTLNDFNDTDTGANNLQNYPLINAGASSGGFTNLSGSINTTANTTLTLDFFVSPDRDASGYGEGSTYIGSTTVTTNNLGNAGFNPNFNTVLNYSGFYATATATDPNGNTSEFSPAVRIGCSYNISSTSQNFPTAGGTGSFNLTTTSACDWQAVRSADWITITGGASGTGSGTISFAVAPNPGNARTGTITVGGRVFTVTQATDCAYSLVSNTATHPASGGNDGNSVFAPAGCTWTTVSNVQWITVTSGANNSGNGSFTYSVAPNTGPARQGTLTVAGLTYTINQLSGCAYQLSHFSAGYPAQGTNFDGVSVIAGSGCAWMAASNAHWITVTSGANGSGNGTVIWSVAANPGAARQGTLTIAGQTFTINQARASRRVPFDFDGDGRTDISIFRPSVGEWWYLRSSDGGNAAFQFGNSSDKPVPADYTGDGRTDGAFYRPSTGEWYFLRSENGSYYSVPFGASGDIPAPADFDGDGRADVAVYRPSEGNWYISLSTGGTRIQQFGLNGDYPVPHDFDGDGKADLAIWRASAGEWWILQSSNNLGIAFQFGSSGDKPVPADYTGDGKTDAAFWHPSTGEWFILRSENFSYYSVPFGLSGDIPAAGDYDGDGKADIAVFRPSNTNWYVQRSDGNGFIIAPFGNSSDRPVPASFIP